MKTGIILLLLAGLLAVLFLTTGVQSNTDGGRAAAFAAPTPAVNPNQGYHYGVRNLIGATPAQVGEFALEYARQRAVIYSGTPQVLLSRPVTSDELAALGLSCLYFGTIEKPPLIMVILKGDFGRLDFGSTTATPRFKYVVYAFDVWAAEATLTVGTPNGGLLRKALNDPTLPDDASNQIDAQPRVCPTEPPTTRHYGEVAPTAVLPTIDPKVTLPSDTPLANPPLPEAVATQTQ